MDFPYYLYEMVVHGRTEFPTEYKENIYCRNTTLDLKWMRENLMDHKGEVLRESANLLLLRERNDSLVLDDPYPGIAEIAGIAMGPVRSVRDTAAMRMRARPFMRRRTARRLRSSMSVAGKILFVCMGNICRSPFGEHYARKVLTGVQVSSSGTYEKQDRRTPDDGVAAAKDHGLDLTGHRSRTVTEQMVNEADVVFVFDQKNMREMWERFPKQKGKMFFISEVDPTAPLVTEDPYGKDPKAYESAYRRIAAYLDQMASYGSK
jgi:protein-tyrosine phosphatase